MQRAFVPNLGAASTSKFTRGLASPWCLAFLPDGRMLVTRKAGQLLLLSASGLPAVGGVGQGGLPDAVVDRAFARNRRICFSFSEANAGSAALNGTAVARAELDAAALRLVNLSVICRQRPKVGSSGHRGYRLVFDGHREGGRERLRGSLGQRIRDVRQGPDDQLYLLSDDASNGRLLRVSVVSPEASQRVLRAARLATACSRPIAVALNAFTRRLTSRAPNIQLSRPRRPRRSRCWGTWL